MTTAGGWEAQGGYGVVGGDPPPAGGWQPSAPPPTPGGAGDAYPSYAAVAIVVAVVGLLAAALVTALTFDAGHSSGADTWKLRVKIMALGFQVFFAAGSGGGILAGVALLVALNLVRTTLDAPRAAAFFVGVGACAAAVWIVVVTVVGVYVDLTIDLPNGGTAASVISDVATLVVLGAAGAWAVATASSSR